MFERINLEKELFKIRENKSTAELDVILESFKDLFRADWEREKRINQSLSEGSNKFYLPANSGLDSSRIFNEDDIKALCISYRLRFLSTKHFKSEFPLDAIRSIKNIENQEGTEIKNFMIAAPSQLFKLHDANADPLLFAPLNDGTYYLIHKWGKDMAWYKKLTAIPFRSLAWLIGSILTISIFSAALIPTEIISASDNYLNFGRFAFSLWLMLSLGAIVSFLWFTLNQKFSDQSWKSHHFN